MLGLFLLLPVLALYARTMPDYSPVLLGLAMGAYGLTQARAADTVRPLVGPLRPQAGDRGRAAVLCRGLADRRVRALARGTAGRATGAGCGRGVRGGHGAARRPHPTRGQDARDGVRRHQHRPVLHPGAGARAGARFAGRRSRHLPDHAGDGARRPRAALLRRPRRARAHRRRRGPDTLGHGRHPGAAGAAPPLRRCLRAALHHDGDLSVGAAGPRARPRDPGGRPLEGLSRRVPGVARGHDPAGAGDRAHGARAGWCSWPRSCSSHAPRRCSASTTCTSGGCWRR